MDLENTENNSSLLPNNEPIFVTSPPLPPLDKFVEELKKIWATRKLSNFGPYYEKFKSELSRYLGSPNLEIVNNGTVGLWQILRSLDLPPGEVITTPFTFPATSHSIYLAGHKPVFADILKDTLNLDPAETIKKITPNTRAILPVHVFGNPCDTAAFDKIGKDYNIPIIYDAAHCFGAQINHQSLVTIGDFSMVSFHATKILHTFEGGLIYFKDPEQKARQRAWSNFGFDAEGNPEKVGFNSKITEINALMGSLLLENVDDQIRFRSELVKLYRGRLSGLAGIDPIQFSPQLRQNHQYFPVIVRKHNSPNVRDELWQFLQTKNIFSRRYFYPLCSNIPEYQADAAQFPIANAATQSILCLPLSGQLSSQQVNYICEQIISFMKK